MFGLGVGTIIKGAIFVAIVSVGVAGFHWFKGVLQENRDLTASLTVEKENHAQTKAAFTSYKADAERRQAQIQASLTRLSKDSAAAKEEAAELRKVLGKHDFGHLAQNKPGLVQSRVNAGTVRVLEGLERISETFASGDLQPAAAE